MLTNGVAASPAGLVGAGTPKEGSKTDVIALIEKSPAPRKSATNANRKNAGEGKPGGSPPQSATPEPKPKPKKEIVSIFLFDRSNI